jgi:hypothetical protein
MSRRRPGRYAPIRVGDKRVELDRDGDVVVDEVPWAKGDREFVERKMRWRPYDYLSRVEGERWGPKVSEARAEEQEPEDETPEQMYELIGNPIVRQQMIDDHNARIAAMQERTRRQEEESRRWLEEHPEEEEWETDDADIKDWRERHEGSAKKVWLGQILPGEREEQERQQALAEGRLEVHETPRTRDQDRQEEFMREQGWEVDRTLPYEVVAEKFREWRWEKERREREVEDVRYFREHHDELMREMTDQQYDGWYRQERFIADGGKTWEENLGEYYDEMHRRRVLDHARHGQTRRLPTADWVTDSESEVWKRKRPRNEWDTDTDTGWSSDETA